MCEKKGIVTAANVVDHIIPLRIDYNKRLDVNNLQSLCNKCHNIKTKNDQYNRYEDVKLKKSFKFDDDKKEDDI